MVSTITPNNNGALNFRRCLTLFIALFCLTASQNIWAQSCDIIVSGSSQPVEVFLDLDPTPSGQTGGSSSTSAIATLNGDVVSGTIYSNGATCSVYTFYYGATQDLVSTQCFLDAPDDHTVQFDCNDIDGLTNTCSIGDPATGPGAAANVAGPYQFWVSIGDGQAATPNESQLIELTVYVREATAPDVFCPDDINILNPNCGSGAVAVDIPGFNQLNYDDNCAVVEITRTVRDAGGVIIPSGLDTDSAPPSPLSIPTETFNLMNGVYTVEFMAEDEHGNTNTCTFEVNVSSPRPIATCTDLHNTTLSTYPTASGPVVKSVVDAEDLLTAESDPCGFAITDYFAIRADDPSLNGMVPDPTQVNKAQVEFTCADIGSTVTVYVIVVTSDGRRSLPCDADVRVTDPFGPAITCPADAIVDACSDTFEQDKDPSNTGMATTNNTSGCPVAAANLTFEDNVDPNTIIGQNCYTINRTWTATKNGQTATCVQRIYVRDLIDPEFEVFPNNDTISCGTPIPDYTITGFDNCNNDVFIELIDSTSTQNQWFGSCLAHNYRITRTWKVTDRCGNYATRSQVVQVEDNDAPEFISIHPSIQITQVPDSDTESPDLDEYVANKALTLQPGAGCNTTFTLTPVINDCASNDFLDIDYILYEVDNAGNETISASGSVTPGGDLVLNLGAAANYRIAFEAQDPCLNVSTLSIDIEIDAPIPNANCDNIDHTLDNFGFGSVNALDIDEGSTEACSTNRIIDRPDNPLDYLQIRRIDGTLGAFGDEVIFNCEDIGMTIPVQLEVTDPTYGTVNYCTGMVTIFEPMNANGSSTLISLNANVDATPISSVGATDGSVSVTNVSGGSGTYTYLWDTPNANTTTTVNGLGEGTYTVTVTDTASGCTTTASATVSFAVTFGVSSIQGPASTTPVAIPITVNNFSNIRSFSFCLDISDGTVATLSSVNQTLNTGTYAIGPNPAAGNLVTVSWSSGTPVTLPPGTTVLELLVTLVGNDGDVTPVTIGDCSITDFEVTEQGSNGATTIAEFGTDGLITINNNINTFTLRGSILDRLGDPMSNVTVEVTSGIVASGVTDANGNYVITGIPSGSDVVVRPVSQNNTFPADVDFWKNGVSTIDASIIQASAANIMPITGARRRIAADVNNSGMGSNCQTSPITTIDATQIQALAVGNIMMFPQNQSWRFVRANHTFAAPDCPWTPAFPESTPVNNITANVTGVNFTAIKIGDVGGSTANPNHLQGDNTDTRSNESLVLTTDEINVLAGGTYRVPFYARNFSELLSWQFSLEFDQTALAVESVEAGDIVNMTEGNFGLNFLTEGVVNVAWFNAESVSIDENTPVFYVNFRALSDATTLSEMLTITSKFTPVEAYNSEMEELNVEIEFVNSPTSIAPVAGLDFKLYQNKPNPFQNETIIGFKLSENSSTTLTITDMAGRVIKIIEGDFVKGDNTITVSAEDMPAGILYYQLRTDNSIATKKMILVK